jgi:hypothetical protein
MGIARLAAIGMVALTTMTQTGWGQGVDNDRAQLIEQIRQLSRSNTALQKLLKASGTEPPREFIETLPSLDVRFAGGTLGDLVEELKSRRPYSNILLGDGAGAVKVPPFEVFGVTPAGAIWVARSVVGPDWNMQIDTVNPGDGSAATTIVRVSEDQKVNAALAWSAPSKAWNLNSWIGEDPERIDATFAVIQVGLDSFDSSGVTLKFHQPTKVLMARGTQAHIDFIDSVIRAAAEMPLELNALPQNVVIANEVIAKSSRRIAEIEGEVAVLAARADVVDARVARLIGDKAGEETIATQRIERAEIHARINNLRFEEATLREAVEKAKKTVAGYEAKNNR